ncbi:tetratricopeptide repeat protein [Sphingomonadaceae bacterium LXI357]|uniref:Tetratricopeptide repeat protein n=2 Tax=Stakelama marina TaxID=2826939 RepID=A0A8T4IND3_9SPHN|nr:tetratricopeptide repeat protein [Stakelama marina]
MLLVSSSSVALASETPKYAPAPDWVVAAPPVDGAKLDDSSPILQTFDQQDRIENGTVWEYRDTAIRINSMQMLNQAGTVQLPWQPDQGDLIIHKAEIIRGDQHIDLLAKGAKFTVLHREQQMEKLMLDGVLTATMTVEGLRVGDVLRMVVSTTRKDGALGGNAQALMQLMAKPAPIRFARTRLTWPKTLDLHWKSLADGVEAKPVEKDGYEILDLPVPLPKEKDMPKDAPMRFHRVPLLEASTFGDWAQVSEVMAPLYATDGTIADGSDLAREVAKIEQASSDPKVRAAAALRLVQDKVRYLFKGMDGGNYEPQSPAKTWELRYGDCKAKSLLLLALLRKMGIEAEPVLANSKLGDLVAMRLPSAAAFDHVLIRAKVGGETLWLDGTRTGDRLADMTDTPNFDHVLPLRSDGAGLLAIQLHPDARPAVDVAIRYDQTAGLSLPTPYTIAVKLRGPLADMVHSAETQNDEDKNEQMVESIISDYIDGGVMTDHSVDYDADAAVATVHASGIVGSPWNKKDNRYQIGLDHVVSGFTFDVDRAKQDWRDIPVNMGGPSSLVVHTSVALPDKGKGFAFEGDRTLPQEIATTHFSRTATIEDGVMKVDEKSLSAGGELPVEDIAATRAALAKANANLLRGVAPADYAARWAEVQQDRADGRLDALKAAYAKAIEKEPDDAQSYLNRAYFRSQVFDWKGAIADYDKAIALNATADNYLSRAAIRSMLGEHEAAVKDIEAARKLEPGAAGPVLQLAGVYSDMGQPDKALALLDEQLASGGDDKSNLITQKAEVLARAGRPQDAIAAVDAMIAKKPGNTQLLNQRCWVKGTTSTDLPSALKDCTKAIELAESPAGQLDSRAMVYFKMDRYDDALADLNAALNLVPDLPASMFLRGVIRLRQGDKKAGEADLSAARLMSPRIDERYAKYGVKP